MRFLKIVLVVGLIAVVFVGGLIFAIPYLVNVESFGPKITQQLESSLGRKVSIGKIRLSLFPLSVVVEKLGIAEDPKFGQGDFATLEALRVDVSLTALAQRQLEITTLEAEHPTILLIKNKAGAWNIDSLSGGKVAGENAPAKAAGGAVAAAPSLEVGKLRLVDGTVKIDDFSGPKPSHQEFDHITASAEHLSQGKPFDFLFSTKMGKGTMEMAGTAGPFRPGSPPSLPLQAHVKLDNMDIAQLAGADAAKGLATGTIDIDHNGREAKFEGTVKINELQTGKKSRPAQIPVTANFKGDYMPLTENLSLNHLTVNVGQSAATASGIINRRMPELSRINLKADKAALPEIGKLLPAFGVVLPNNSSFASGMLTQVGEFHGSLQPLNGNATLDVENAKLSGYSIAEKVAAVARFAGIKTSSDTEIQTLKVGANFVNGAATFSNIELVMPGLTVTGGGTMSAEGQLDMRMTAALTGNAIGTQLLKMVTAKGVPFLIRGTVDNPQFVPDVRGIAQQQVPTLNDLKNGQTGNLGKALSGLFGKKKN